MANGTRATEPQVLTIAAAADLNFALPEIAARFERQTNSRVRLSFGSSGNIFNQIRNGAPFDLFFSADMNYPRELEAAGLTIPGSRVRYAVGRLALVLSNGSVAAPTGINVLLDPSIQRVAIANPQHAPYGRAAVAALRHFGLYDKVASKLVFGENVSQAAQFVQSGNAQAGLVALSLVLAMKTSYWIVPSDAHPALEQGAVILKASHNEALARRFVSLLSTPAAAAILRGHGFEVAQ